MGESFPLDGDRMTIGRRPDCDIFLDDVTVSRDHALLVRRGDEIHIDDLGSLNGTYVNRQRIESAQARRRRRAADRQVQADVPGADDRRGTGDRDRGRRQASRPRKSMTIGAVCKALEQEFPDISISKIRYLEDQKLLSPRRTPGGYRLYSQSDVARLRTILRLQRDEFLPLRVIRQELAAGRSAADIARAGRPTRAPGARARRRRVSVQERGRALLARRRARGDAAPSPARRRARGLRRHQGRGPRAAPSTTTRPSARSSAPSPSWPATASAGATCACFRTSADRESALLQQILAPALRSRNPERRKEALEALENLAAVTSHLKHLLLVRDLRRIAD